MVRHVATIEELLEILRNVPKGAVVAMRAYREHRYENEILEVEITDSYQRTIPVSFID